MQYILTKEELNNLVPKEKYYAEMEREMLKRILSREEKIVNGIILKGRCSDTRNDKR